MKAPIAISVVPVATKLTVKATMNKRCCFSSLIEDFIGKAQRSWLTDMKSDFSDELLFLGKNSRYNDNIQNAAIFSSMLEARLYIEKNQLNRIGIIRKNVSSEKSEE